ncbi:MAG: sulfur oxidation c-type cytochrome SoxX [Burkholderiaceae bacterium]|jgi:sulfur-oxidizing protein SoxX
MRNMKPFLLAAVSAILLSACAISPDGPSNESITKLMKQSFAERGAAKLDRLDQSELQRVCSEYTGKEMPKAVKEKLEQAALASVKYPADGKYLGDFKRGERVAQSGVGMQFSDKPGTVAGGNCYACHQISKQELAYGNIGPSLYNYGKLRGDSEAILKYTWARLYNAHAFNACNTMPRFGAAGILTEAQMKDVMALLLDPKSPVNQ